MFQHSVNVTNGDGEAVHPGWPVADRWGNVWTFKRVTHMPSASSTGYVRVTRRCVHTGECPRWCTGVSTYEMPAADLYLTITHK